MTDRDPKLHGLARQAMAFVLAGGRGTRLMELTESRAKPAVYFGGKSRIVDFTLSNALNSGIRRLAVATQYKAHSLIRHLQRGWTFLRPERNESFDILPASQRISEDQWYAGTADAIYQNLDIIERYGPRYVVVLAGDHIYKMDYELMLQQHVDLGADVTVGCLELPRSEASGFGVMAVDGMGRITSFLEKPADPPGMPGRATPVPGTGAGTIRSFADIGSDGAFRATTIGHVDTDGTVRPLLEVPGSDTVLQTCVSPSGQYAAMLVAPDLASNPYDTYQLPLPATVETHIVELPRDESSEARELVALAGSSISWCRQSVSWR